LRTKFDPKDDVHSTAGLRFCVAVMNGIFLGQHSLMQNAQNHNAITLLTVKHDLRAVLHTAQTRTNVVAVAA